MATGSSSSGLYDTCTVRWSMYCSSGFLCDIFVVSPFSLYIIITKLLLLMLITTRFSIRLRGSTADFPVAVCLFAFSFTFILCYFYFSLSFLANKHVHNGDVRFVWEKNGNLTSCKI